MAAAANGAGYWLVASDGGIFAFGDAPVPGLDRRHPPEPARRGHGGHPDGGGYWLVASDGGIFTYGDAPFWGSTGGIHLSEPIVGMTPTQDGNGYWLVGQDAGVFNYGDAAVLGERAVAPPSPALPPAPVEPDPPVVSIINEATGPQATHQGMQRVAFSGDSLSLYEGDYVEQTNPPYAVDDGAAAGCGYTDGAPTIPWSNPGSALHQPGGLRAVGDAAAVGRVALPSRRHGDSDRLLGDAGPPFNGTYTTLANPAYAAFIQNNLAQAVQIAHSDGGAVILSTSPYFADGTPNAWSTTTTRSCGRWRPSTPTCRSTTSSPCSTPTAPTPRWWTASWPGPGRGAHHPGGGGHPH